MSCIWQVNVWKLREDATYSTESFRGFSQFLQANIGKMPQASCLVAEYSIHKLCVSSKILRAY